ncbi:MAG: hypothetical protein NZ898_01220 [Myxococcota bacterium]|nr:hypothetical protein [Myxococcota bacterium]MDW8360785.1 hypothetical protein [Myxococcales bacterium]
MASRANRLRVSPPDRFPDPEDVAVVATFARVLALLLLLLGCSEQPPPPPPPPPRPPERPPLVGPRAVSSRAAFDLVASRQGAFLVFGPTQQAGGGLVVQPLDAIGAPRGSEIALERIPTRRSGELPPPYALEVVAATAAGRLGVAYVVAEDAGIIVRAVHASDDLQSSSPPQTLAETGLRLWRGRGQVGLAASADGTLSLLARAGTAPCEASSQTAPTNLPRTDVDPDLVAAPARTCVRIRAWRLASPPSLREAESLLLPDACEGPIVGHLWSDGVWYHAVCNLENGVPVTTGYAIQFDPPYARADRLLEGTWPVGLAPVASGLRDGRGGVILVAEDGAMVAIGPMLSGVPMPTTERRVRCDAGRPVLEGGPVRVALSAPTSRLESLLPPQLAPAGARAVWTGEALLVAVPASRDVIVRRYQCERGELVRTERFGAES